MLRIQGTRCGLLAMVVLAFVVDVAYTADPQPATQVSGPLSAEASLQHVQVAPGLRIELVAAEPQVVDPVAIAFDEDGRMWVVEMTDYPNGPSAGQPPKSRVRVLEDTDGDGRFETARTFVDQLLFATGLQLWKGGVFVTLAGKVVYYRDTTGDGKADVHETWFSGFAQKNQQLRANHPTLGLDNRIYIANGLRDGTIVGRPSSDGKPPEPLSISGRDFRFNPHSGDYDTVTGRGQFGLTFDDFGNRFVCTNRNATKHIVLKQRYIERNPHLAVPAATYDVSPPGASAVVFPLSRNWTHYSDHAGQITAACGVLVYRGNALPAEYSGNVFICEPPGNLVHRRVLIPQGATFASRRVRKGVEFLASPDDWFRPVNLTIGPDGALYVVDMYRAVIEHPHWLPDDLSDKLPLKAGSDRGRIYRIVGSDVRAQPPADRQRLSTAGSQRLVQLLEHPNSWQRETAARLLYQRQDAGVTPALRALVRSGRTPAARVHALWALQGIGQLTEDATSHALEDSHPRVREQAVVLSERWLDTSPSLWRKVAALSEDADARLRFQIALSLGQAKRNNALAAELQRIALHKASDSWTRTAVLSSLSDLTAQQLIDLLKRIGSKERSLDVAVERLVADLSHLLGAGNDMLELRNVLQAMTSRKQAIPRRLQLVVMTSIGRGLASRNGSFAESLIAIGKDDDALGRHLDQLLARVVSTAEDAGQPLKTRRQCVDLLRFVGFQHGGQCLIRLAESAKSQPLRLHAIDAVSSYDDAQIGRVLLSGFRSQTPAVRSAVLDGMLSDDNRTRQLLDAFSQQRIAISDLSPTIVQRLVNHRDKAIQQRAQRLLAAAIPANRQQVLTAYRKALSLTGSAARGRLVFQKNCAECHRIGQIGVQVGPYIGDFLLKPNARTNPIVILESILNPNRAIDANYVSYSIVTNTGKVHTGVIAQETSTSVTLKQAKNKTVTVLRNDIEELRSNGISLMPEGFEKNIRVEEMADLIVFLRDWRFLNDLVPLDGGQ